MPGGPLLATLRLAKSFGSSRVLDDVSLDVRAGEVHVIAGANGAGKTTLLRILSGAETAYGGDVLLDGAPIRFAGPRSAQRAGIRAIHQELSLVGALRVVDNLFLAPDAGSPFRPVARRDERARAARLFAELDLAVDPEAVVEELPIAAQQLIEIARALVDDARVLIFDEPTSALSEAEASVLFDRIRALRAAGRGILYVSHRLEEIYALADRVTVLRDGAVVGTSAPADLPRERLVAWMVGDEARREAPDDARIAGEPVLEVDGLAVPSRAGGPRLDVQSVSFALRRGEIVGLAGLRGSGASALLEALFGARPASGCVSLDGQPVRAASPRACLARGLAYVSSDRRATGLVLDRSVVENAALSTLAHDARLGWIDRAKERERVSTAVAKLHLVAPSLDAPARTLSGGNQQKVFLARSLLTTPKVLLLDEPTRGVDVSAKADIHRELRRLARTGTALLWHTADLEELLAVADRILVLHGGRMAADLPRAEVTRARVLAAAMGDTT